MVVLSICLEEVPGRFTRCVAVPGRQPGLRLDDAGEIRWRDGGGLELWTSADERLVLYRAAGAPPLRLHRAARVLDVPAEKPVILVGGDELELGRRRYRVHLHGVAAAVAAPEALAPAPSVRLGRAAAVVLGAALAGCPGPQTPGVTPPPPDTGGAASPDAAPVTPPIVIRDLPASPPYIPPEEGQPPTAPIAPEPGSKTK
jgi:hypothetical protein